MVCLLTRQHLVQVDGQQQVKDAVENEHEQRDVERMRAVGQRREHSAISLSLQVNHLHTHTGENSFVSKGGTKWNKPEVHSNLLEELQEAPGRYATCTGVHIHTFAPH